MYSKYSCIRGQTIAYPRSIMKMLRKQPFMRLHSKIRDHVIRSIHAFMYSKYSCIRVQTIAYPRSVMKMLRKQPFMRLHFKIRDHVIRSIRAFVVKP